MAYPIGILQTISTCKHDEDFKSDKEETWGVMNLNNLAKSPYLNHPIWFLGTMKNTNCSIPKYNRARRAQPAKNASQHVARSAWHSFKYIAHTTFLLLFCTTVCNVIQFAFCSNQFNIKWHINKLPPVK